MPQRKLVGFFGGGLYFFQFYFFKAHLFVSSGKMSLATYFMLWPIPCSKKFLELDRGYSMKEMEENPSLCLLICSELERK